MWNQMMSNGPILMVGVMALFGVLAVSGIVILAKALFSGSESSNILAENGSDILKARYARGEMGAEEFAQKKRDLRH